MNLSFLNPVNWIKSGVAAKALSRPRNKAMIIP